VLCECACVSVIRCLHPFASVLQYVLQWDAVCCVSVRVCLLYVASILLLVVHMQGFGNVFAVGTAGCSVLQCDAVCCSGMQCVAVCSMWCDTVCCSVMLCVAV